MKLRKWVVVVLSVIATLSVVVMASDCESTEIFIISHLIACATFTLSIMILLKYSGIIEE